MPWTTAEATKLLHKAGLQCGALRMGSENIYKHAKLAALGPHAAHNQYFCDPANVVRNVLIKIS